MAHRLAVEAGVTWWATRDQVTAAECTSVSSRYYERTSNSVDVFLSLRILDRSFGSEDGVWCQRQPGGPSPWCHTCQKSHGGILPGQAAAIAMNQGLPETPEIAPLCAYAVCRRRKNTLWKPSLVAAPGVRSDGHAATPLQELPEVPLCRVLQEAGRRYSLNRFLLCSEFPKSTGRGVIMKYLCVHGFKVQKPGMLSVSTCSIRLGECSPSTWKQSYLQQKR